MKNYIVILLSIMIVGCGAKVEVPPAHVGKILGKNGYAPETIPPSKFRLPACLAYCAQLVVLEASDQSFKESIVLFMPKDKLNLTIDLRGTMSVPADENTIDNLFGRLPAQVVKDGDYHSIITAGKVYSTYGRQALRGIVRSELVKYTIGDVLKNREAIGQNIHQAISEKLKSTETPLIISRFEMANVQPPKVIVEAQQKAKEREIAIQQAEADAKVELVKADRDLEIARKTRLVEKEKALAIAEQNKIAAKSITPQLLAYRKLEVAERVLTAMANNQNSMIVPADMSGLGSLDEAASFAKMLGKEIK